ncbi:hypothetical protein O6H91_19G037600 [Diphasiastrum complanatum]|uniref:Uncharacterized protein n=1 Tax=Diphasiastrum complanatum TaxID=34168 RepID=A0ACC2AU65_DIPCM|nr:hypothetical protein O6H91_19G037600 [Diphasiastrum complanatum]
MQRREACFADMASVKDVSGQTIGSGQGSPVCISSSSAGLLCDGRVMYSPVYENFSATGDELDTGAEPIGSSSQASSDGANLHETDVERYYWRFGDKIMKENQSHLSKVIRFDSDNGDSSQFELTDGYRTDSLDSVSRRRNSYRTYGAIICRNASSNEKYEEWRSRFLSSTRDVDYVSETSDEYRSPVEQLSDFDRTTSCRESIRTDDLLSEIDEPKFIQGPFKSRDLFSDRALEQKQVIHKTSIGISQIRNDPTKFVYKEADIAFSGLALPVDLLTHEFEKKHIQWTKPLVQSSEDKHKRIPSADVQSKASEARFKSDRFSNAWETLLVYVGCVQLCLHASASGHLKASEFLSRDCFLLRESFGLDELLLHPKEDCSCKERHAGNYVPSIQNQSMRTVKVQVLEVKMKLTMPMGCGLSYMSRRLLRFAKLCRNAKLRSERSTKSTVTHKGRLTGVFKAGLKKCRRKTVMPPGMLSYVMRLQNATKEQATFVQPGCDETAVFFSTSTGDNLIFEVYDRSRNQRGRALIHIDSISKAKPDKASWWQIYNESGKQPIGKVRMVFSYVATRDTSKWGSIEKTLAYDILLEAAIRMQQFQQRNLHMHSSWKWLLSEFAQYYGVSVPFANLRYLMSIMELATPTSDCLMLVHDLLCPVLGALSVYALTENEQWMLAEVKQLVIQLLAIVFQNYKSLDEFSKSGLADTFLPPSANMAPALEPAVQIYMLLHDIFSMEGKQLLGNYFQIATEQRCIQLMKEVQELTSNGRQCTHEDPYVKMKNLCESIAEEIRADIDINNQHILPCSIDLPSISVRVYVGELDKRLRAFLVAFPPLTTSSQISDLLVATVNFENNLASWGFSFLKGTFQTKEIFQTYIKFWIQNMCSQVFSACSGKQVHWTGAVTQEKTIPFVEDLYDLINSSLNDFDAVVRLWPQCIGSLEIAAIDMEKAVMTAIEKHHSEVLPSHKSVQLSRRFLLQYLQKVARRPLYSSYDVSNQFGMVMNTIKRLADVRHPQVRNKFKTWLSLCSELDNQGQLNLGERLGEVAMLLHAKYKSYVQAVVKKLARKKHGTKLDRVLHDIRQARGEREIRELMNPLKSQLMQIILHLDDVFIKPVLLDVCRGYLHHLSQDVLRFFRNWKEKKAGCNYSGLVLAMLDDTFSSQVQGIKENAAQATITSPPYYVIDAQSMRLSDNKANKTNDLLYH